MHYKLFWALRAIIYRLFFREIGWYSYMGKPLYIQNPKKISIGSKVRLFPHYRMETHGKNSSIIIEDNCSIGQNFHIVSSGDLVIEKNTVISFDVMITNTDHEYSTLDTSIVNQPLITKKTHISENCFIGSGAKIQAGTVLGKQCVVGANAVVRGTFPDYSVIVGIPAKIVKRYNESSGKWEKTNAKGEFIHEI